ncbi:MAG: S8 family serine peptidase [Burkholderiales bacterium]|nr:S8 family serine peptidase [Burkholderiales bacterium]
MKPVLDLRNFTFLLSILWILNGLSPASAQEQAQEDTLTVPQKKELHRKLLVMLHLPAQHFRPDVSYAGAYRQDAGRVARRQVAQELAHTMHMKILEDWPMPLLNIDCFQMELIDDANAEDVILKLKSDKRVAWAQVVNEFEAKASAGNSATGNSIQPAQLYWSLREVHHVTTGKQVLVAVIDSAVETQHPDLRGQIESQENFVDGKPWVAESHGTHVAGVIVAKPGNHLGIVGIAPDARVMALRACAQDVDGKTQCSGFSLAKALYFAINKGVKIINLSLSGPDDRLLRQLIDLALSRDIKVVTAIDVRRANGGYPASHPGVFSVSDKKMKSTFSSVLVAPGQDIPTTSTGQTWSFVSGSSYSTAHVTGMLALLTQLQPTISSDQLRHSLTRMPDMQGRPEGLLSLCDTLSKATAQCICACQSGK